MTAPHRILTEALGDAQLADTAYLALRQGGYTVVREGYVQELEANLVRWSAIEADMQQLWGKS